MDITQTNRGAPKLDFLAALKSGFIVGVLFVLMPMGIPWSRLAFGLGTVMGRETGFQIGILIHLIVALIYGLVIAVCTKRFRSWRVILAGALTGFLIYGLNIAVVWLLAPELLGNETRILVTHLLFGAFASAIYAGMSRKVRPTTVDRCENEV